MVVKLLIERFSIECRKTKTKVITLANHKGHKHYSESIKTRSNAVIHAVDAKRGKTCVNEFSVLVLLLIG